MPSSSIAYKGIGGKIFRLGIRCGLMKKRLSLCSEWSHGPYNLATIPFVKVIVVGFSNRHGLVMWLIAPHFKQKSDNLLYLNCIWIVSRNPHIHLSMEEPSRDLFLHSYIHPNAEKALTNYTSMINRLRM